MPELGTYGSVRGALSNERPYRDPARAHDGRSPAARLAGMTRREAACLRHMRLP